MKDLTLSDITIMREGYCVVGLEQAAQGVFHSVRPMPPRGYAWREPFHYGRGTMVRFVPVATLASSPHLEDQNTEGLAPAGQEVGEVKLIDMLRRAEVSDDLVGLFVCELHADSERGNSWADPSSATRSICGFEFKNIRFRVFGERGDVNLRARLVLPSGEILNSLPVVDRDWRRFFDDWAPGSPPSRTAPSPETFLNQSIRVKLMRAPYRFARIGLARQRLNEKKCWLMLDSLFPQPNAAWLPQ